MTEEMMRSCSGPTDMKICPADQVVFTDDIETCALSLYLQADASHTVCDKQVFNRPPEPTLIRHGAAVVFYTKAPRMVFFRCRSTAGWETSTVTLNGAGVIEGAARCHVNRSIECGSVQNQSPDRGPYGDRTTVKHRTHRNPRSQLRVFRGIPEIVFCNNT
jgi:hypothetical protein